MQIFTASCGTWMDGFGIGCATAFGPESFREKKPERKRKNLIQLGVEQGMAYAWSRTRKGGWAIAQSPILGTTITLKALKRRGYESMLDYYLEITHTS